MIIKQVDTFNVKEATCIDIHWHLLLTVLKNLERNADKYWFDLFCSCWAQKSLFYTKR